MGKKKIQSRMIARMTKRSLKAGRLKNIFVMVTIFLSVSLLSGLLLFAAGQQEEMRRILSHVQHAVYYELTAEQMAKLEQDSRIRYLLKVKSGITSELDGCSLTPWYISELSDEVSIGELEEGELPAKGNQAAVQAAFLEKMGIEPEIGETFTVTFYDGNTESFEVSGILKGSDSNKNFVLMLSEKYAESGTQLADKQYELYAKIKGAEEMGKEECKELIYQIGLEAGMEYKYIAPTRPFLDSLSIDSQMVLLSAGVGAVILFACILVIYGVFYISVIGRIHQFGQLRTIGMTRKQIKKFVKKEGSRLFYRALPFGILAGGIAGYFMKPEGWSFENAVCIFILVAIINYLITMVSVLKPAKLAANISPMEALRYHGSDEMKKAGNRKLYRKLTPLALGFINFSKNKKKTVITMLSLGLGGILFMVSATYMCSFNREQYSRQLDFKEGEYTISIPESAIELNEHGMSGIQSNSPLSDTLLASIEQIKGVKKVISTREFGVQFDYEKEKEYGTNNSVIPVTDKEAQELFDAAETNGIDIKQFMSGDYVFIRDNAVAKEIYGWQFAIGEKLVFHYWTGSEMEQREVKIAGFIDDYASRQDGWFIMPEKALEDWVEFDSFDSMWVVSTEEEQEQAVGEELKNLLAKETELELNTLQDRRERDKENISRMFGAIAGLSVFIMLFSILSMMNTLITNIVTRKQELAMLESIGMGKTQIQNMILGECFTLSCVDILMTVFLGTGAGYMLCSALDNMGAHYMKFCFPGWFFLAYVVLLLAVPAVITFVSLGNFSKEALVERLRGMEN